MNHYSKFFTSLLLGAIAIVGCQREPKVEPNPNFNPETDEVNAAFIMSIATGSSTKMSAENVQQNTNFLGIHKAKIILYADGEQPAAFVKSTEAAANFKQLYDLDEILTSGSLNAANNSTSSSNRVVELSIPLGADAALFYGKAINNSPGKAQGKMDFTHIAQLPADTYFAVSRRIGTEEDVENYDATARLMIKALNTILTTSIGEVTSYTNHGKTYPTAPATELPELKFPDLGHQYELKTGPDPYQRTCQPWDRSLVPLENILGQAYSKFTVIKNNEFRAGSSNAIKNMMQDLYKVVSTVANADPTGDLEANAVRLAEQIITTMKIFFNDNWTYKSVTSIHDALITAGILDQAAWDNTTTGYAGAQDLNNYPYGDFGIPEGAAQLAFHPEGSGNPAEPIDRFEYLHPNKALVTPGREFEPRKYVYPAELAYYVNSPLWITSKSDLTIGDYPNGTTPWNTTGEGSKWTLGGWTIDKVQSSTRGVAIRDNINYGVALMETRVDWSVEANTNGKIKDNRRAMTNETEDDREINLDDTHFILRGVLIGGVHPRYDWQFLPKNVGNGSGLGTFDGVIYDDAIPYTAIPTPENKQNYTLVYDNFDFSKNDAEHEDNVQNDVYVALEFVNNGDAFWGRDNLIPSGGVFYLGAKLTTKNEHQSAQTLTWPTDHQIPPIYESGEHKGESKKIPRVFIQDFKTKATFRIGVNSLKYAYFSVPDLRSSQMSFGLSVELSWENGYTYDLEFGENPGPANPSPANP